jgi:hypothetical protein
MSQKGQQQQQMEKRSASSQHSGKDRSANNELTLRGVDKGTDILIYSVHSKCLHVILWKQVFMYYLFYVCCISKFIIFAHHSPLNQSNKCMTIFHLIEKKLN